MTDIKELYRAVARAHPSTLYSCIRKGDFTSLTGGGPNPFDKQTTQKLLEYGKGIEISKMSPPYLLSDYLCYLHAGTYATFAKALGVSVQYLEQAVYDSCYWHNGVVLRPEKPGDTGVYTFVNTCIDFNDKNGTVLRSDIWGHYVIWAGATGMKKISRIPFLAEIQEQLLARGVPIIKSVRVGAKVSTGYKGISVKTI